MSGVVHKADHLNGEDSVEIVRLFAWYGYTIEELYASLSEGGATLRRINNDVTEWTMNAEEVDNFCNAWAAFKADREASLKAEEQRKESEFHDACVWVESMGGTVKPYAGFQHIFEMEFADNHKPWSKTSLSKEEVVRRVDFLRSDTDEHPF